LVELLGREEARTAERPAHVVFEILNFVEIRRPVNGTVSGAGAPE
jgi:hypothetical protein